MDWLTNLFSSDPTTAIGNSSLDSPGVEISSPVNTSSNGNSSGGFFNSLISGLGGLGSAALNAYGAYTGTQNTQNQANTAASMSTTVKYLLIGGVALVFVFVLVMLFRRK